MKALYLDVFSGISGDMLVGALLDLGVPLEDLERGLAGLRLDGFHLHATRRQKGSIAGTKFDVHITDVAPVAQSHSHSSAFNLLQPFGHQHGEHSHDHGHEHSHAAGGHSHPALEHRDYASIRSMIEASELSAWVKEKSLAVFHRIAVAEGKVHGMPPERVHFHEVGAVDSIVDIVGACLALESLGKPTVLAGSVIEGTGWVQCAHGKLPLPAPATLEILGARGVKLSQCEEPHELVTPTGAGLLAEFAGSFGPLRDFSVTKVGYGLGTRDNTTRLNVLRILLGELEASVGTNDWEADTIAVLETNLDDINPEVLGHFVESALGSGALDVFHTPIQMKKSRPGVLLTVLCASAEADRFSERMLRETSAFGVRRTTADRRKLRRESRVLQTVHGPVSVKFGFLNGKVIQAAPEYESCRQVAATAGVPLKDVYEAAWRAWLNDPTYDRP